MARADKLSAVEAAYLASACLNVANRATAAHPAQMLAEFAIGFDLDAAPVSLRAVRKALEDGVVRSLHAVRVVVDRNAVLYLASTKSLEIGSLSQEAKIRIYNVIRAGDEKVKLAPLVTLDLGPLLRVGRQLVDAYTDALDRHVVVDSEIMGGLPIVRNSRIPVYTVLGRIEDGESMDDIARDFDHVPREALEAALAYARTHPRRGRPTQFR